VFYVWSIHSANVPIFIPKLWPHSFYNTRYGLALVPLAAVGSAAVASLIRRKIAAAGIVVIVLAPFLIHPKTSPITAQEAQVNSHARLKAISMASSYLAEFAGPNET